MLYGAEKESKTTGLRGSTFSFPMKEEERRTACGSHVQEDSERMKESLAINDY